MNPGYPILPNISGNNELAPHPQNRLIKRTKQTCEDNVRKQAQILAHTFLTYFF